MIPYKQLLILITAIAYYNYGCSSQKLMSNNPQTMKFDFGGKRAIGYTAINATSLYTDAAGFGFEKGAALIEVERGGKDAISDGYVTSEKPFYFSVKIPEGNYNVKVTLGDKEGISDAAIRAECRRMMVNRVQTQRGELNTVKFTLHVRDSFIKNTTNKVRLKPREQNYFHWDNKLTLEFNGASPKINALEITPAAPDVVTVFLAGNSTEVDQAEEPYA
ncbi:MAG TPA: hypothetical protein VM888_04270, partial [Chitinophagaceae bacterium]|nr:hypothetical protein [Chitinophagaceae bacterium]